MREVHGGEARYRQLPGAVDARESVFGWYKKSVARQMDAGSPAYRGTVRDELAPVERRSEGHARVLRLRMRAPHFLSASRM